MEQKTLTEGELQQVKDIRTQVLQLASALGELEYQRIIYQLEYEKLTAQVKELKQQEQAIFAELGKKYGDGIINVETGVIDAK